MRELVSVGVFLTSLAVTATAFADAPATANVIQLGGGFRYGFELEEGDFNPWGVGLGIEAGYTLSNALYLGANFDYFFGDSMELLGGEVKSNIWQLMGEAGYDLGVAGGVVLRPKLGAGIAGISVEACYDDVCEDSSETNFALAPGATFLYLGSPLSFSLDLRYDLIFAEETRNALILSAGIGF